MDLLLQQFLLYCINVHKRGVKCHCKVRKNEKIYNEDYNNLRTDGDISNSILYKRERRAIRVRAEDGSFLSLKYLCSKKENNNRNIETEEKGVYIEK